MVSVLHRVGASLVSGCDPLTPPTLPPTRRTLKAEETINAAAHASFYAAPAETTTNTAAAETADETQDASPVEPEGPTRSQPSNSQTRRRHVRCHSHKKNTPTANKQIRHLAAVESPTNLVPAPSQSDATRSHATWYRSVFDLMSTLLLRKTKDGVLVCTPLPINIEWEGNVQGGSTEMYGKDTRTFPAVSIDDGVSIEEAGYSATRPPEFSTNG
jgi:hypothetical protein